jgi:ABC-type nitrate/sulfonate/bicarbonate transport system ATPase subunit
MSLVSAAGIGKSTLLNLIGGTLEPTVGHITRNAKVPPQLTAHLHAGL